MSSPPLHNSIIALVSLSAGIASKHPDMGLCQLDKLRSMGIADDQINTVIEIARHIRDEAGEKLDAAFDQASRPQAVESVESIESIESIVPSAASGPACCTSTASGQSCC